VARRRVVVTGLGVISPVGNTVQESWDNIVAGRSGIGPITRFDASAFKSRIAGEVKGFDVAAYLLPRRRAGWMSSSITAWRRGSRP
jgi:3-oxoacyl-[acyl-carrier-protein] synthase II